jgi:hypothetical protein
MGKGGRKYRLLIYEYMLNRWWPMTLLLALALYLNVGVWWGAERYFAATVDNPLPVLPVLGGTVLLAVGSICLLFTLLLLIMRKLAYVQLFDDHLRLATPFLRMNISYKRIQRSVTAQLFSLFPPRSLSSWKRELIGPVSNSTVIVIHLTATPLSRAVLRFFLSPFFFYDNTAHLVLFVDDWLRFSTELDSRRSLGRNPRRQPLPSPRRESGLLDDLKRK